MRVELASLVVLGSAAIAAGLIVVLRPLLIRYALARPNARSSHRTPTPQGAGMAVIAAAIATGGLAAFTTLDLAGEPARSLGIVLAATALIALLGAVDDVRPLPVLPRLGLQALLAGAVIFALPDEMRIAGWLPAFAERALLVLALLWFVNLTNFMDGIDWMTVVEIVPLTAALAALGLLGALPPQVAFCALALLGAMLGFAPFNRPVARMFLGDVGSLAIGLICGWMLLMLAGQGHWAAAAILPMYYLADATITLARRLARGERVWQAHRCHFYQLAADRGVPVMTILRRVFATNVALVALAIATVLFPQVGVAVVALGAASGLVAILLLWMARGRA